jgi:hypothetical protein
VGGSVPLDISSPNSAVGLSSSLSNFGLRSTCRSRETACRTQRGRLSPHRVTADRQAFRRWSKEFEPQLPRGRSFDARNNSITIQPKT